jgi:hypothetical protein
MRRRFTPSRIPEDAANPLAPLAPLAMLQAALGERFALRLAALSIPLRQVLFLLREVRVGKLKR